MSVYLICYVSSMLFARSGHHYLSGISLMMAAAYLFWYDYKRSKNLIHLRALFSLFFVGGQGISCLKLSELQTSWSFLTWMCFLVAYVGFFLTFEFLSSRYGNPNEIHPRWHGFQKGQKAIFQVTVVVTFLSLCAFIFEAVVLGYIPFFVRGVPHAYSEFHLTGIHYFTVACVLVPSLSVLYFFIERSKNSRQAIIVLMMNIIAISIPILCVSRFQLILAVSMGVFTYIALQRRLNLFYAVGLIIAMVPVYIMLTIARSHDVAYLNGIFQMKNQSMPIFITQPYMYIANNYDNFNCLVAQLPAHSMGLKMLFPVFALTGLKFLVPSLVHFPLFVTKAELTTLTLFYDAYYDFGIIGVLLFSCILGAVAYLLVNQVRKVRNPIGYLCYVQIAIYFVFSFFTTWFSNPTTWFYLAVTGIIFIYCDRATR